MKRQSKILVRISERQHRGLKKLAANSRRSLNSVCVLGLEALLAHEIVTQVPDRHPTKHRADPALVPLDSIVRHFEPEIEGIILFGSTARGTSSARSDIDLLLVLQAGATLNRDIYERWDDFARDAGVPGRVSPHFSRLPASCEDAGSLWFEVALEGIVLWERDLSLSRYLGRLRHFMLDNNIRRKLSYGVPYWVKGDAKHEACRRLSEEGGTPAEGS